MYNNVVIKGSGMVLGKKSIHKDYFIEHFKKQDIEIEGLLKHLGKEKVYRIDNNDTCITLAEKACNDALANANLKPEDIDAIVFATETPEFTAPSNALYLGNLIKAHNVKMAYDANCNCTSMLLSLDQMVSHMLSSDKINRALVVGSLHISRVLDDSQFIPYPTISDSSVALVLEKEVSEERRGLIASNYYADVTYSWTINYPACGFTKLDDEDIEDKDKKMVWNPFDFSFLSTEWSKLLNEMLEKEGYELMDINKHIFSQFSLGDIITTIDTMDENPDKILYYGDKYGYTGCTSPFLVYHEAMKEGKVKEKDLITLTSVGAGYNMVSLLYKV
ncbi:3-oxoacyl-[acyl-carrier-protein] synthase III C-terminal domain-containing protein [Alloiococcus sp. CFN-8]|uniref:3-oxoacyl-[acyl-carrier-protein] synthase III C-terminal domain-containing protein n=1 Tax=Alloiococcus sp. CFN-8 TaxID=3416081 RepID=UPI003CE9C5F2